MPNKSKNDELVVVADQCARLTTHLSSEMSRICVAAHVSLSRRGCRSFHGAIGTSPMPHDAMLSALHASLRASARERQAQREAATSDQRLLQELMRLSSLCSDIADVVSLIQDESATANAAPGPVAGTSVVRCNRVLDNPLSQLNRSVVPDILQPSIRFRSHDGATGGVLDPCTHFARDDDGYEVLG